MPDREKVIKALECIVADTDLDCKKCDYYIRDDVPQYCATTNVLRDALALLKEQEETINDLTETIRQLNQHIKDLSEYMTPYGKVKDVKAYAELLKEQEAVVRCKDCKWYDKQNNWCISLDIAEQGEDWFCADGERKET